MVDWLSEWVLVYGWVVSLDVIRIIRDKNLQG